jgi:hypothetical protein
MCSPIGESEIRVIVRPNQAPGFQPELISAPVFKKIFDGVLAALIAADRELHPKTVSSEFFISHLSIEPYEFGLIEKQNATGPNSLSSLELFRRCASRVYRSDYQILLRYPRLMRAFHRIVKALNPGCVVLIQYHDTELPLDDFFCRQVDRVGRPDDSLCRADILFAGRAITSFVGRLEALDYRGPVWSGRLMLSGSDIQIECLFDKAKGEDALNPFGNKEVSITGRAIYTGDSELPERIEVLEIEESPRPPRIVDIQGSLAPASSADWEHGLDYIDQQ